MHQGVAFLPHLQDSQVVIERYKSGFTPPGDIPFDDLSTPRQNGDSTPTSHPPIRQDTIKGTISASKLKKRGGIFGIFASNKVSQLDQWECCAATHSSFLHDTFPEALTIAFIHIAPLSLALFPLSIPSFYLICYCHVLS